MAGEELIDFDMATYLCEWETAYRNNAILYTLTKALVRFTWMYSQRGT